MTWLRALGAFVRRDWTIAKSYRLPLLLDLVGPLVSVTIFFYLGRVVDEVGDDRTFAYGTGYFEFALVGLALLNVVDTTLSSFARRLRDDQSTGTFEVLFATSAPRSLVVLGSASFDVLRQIWLGLAILLFGAVLFGFRPEASAESVLAVAACAVALIVFCMALGIVAAAFTVVFKQTTGVLELISNALILLSGVYFPLTVLPGALEALGELSPLAWALDVLRAGLLDATVDGEPLVRVVVAAVVALPAAFALFSVALDRARRAGTLAQY